MGDLPQHSPIFVFILRLLVKIKKTKMIELTKKDGEVDIKLTYTKTIGGLPKIVIEATGDLEHHVVEGMFDVLDRLARMESISHQSKEWKDR